MASNRSLRIKASSASLLTIDRNKIWTQTKKLVYVLVGNRSIKYVSGRRSYVLYIGTTSKGAHRPAASAVDKAMKIFGKERGLKKIGVYLVVCGSRRSLRTWHMLETALLATFRDRYYELPKMNLKRGRYKRTEDIPYFRDKRLRAILEGFEKKPVL